MNTQPRDFDAKTDEALKEIRAARDDIRVRAHLFKMELKDQWAKLEPKLAEAEKHAKAATKESRAALADIGRAFKAFQKTSRT